MTPRTQAEISTISTTLLTQDSPEGGSAVPVDLWTWSLALLPIVVAAVIGAVLLVVGLATLTALRFIDLEEPT